VKQRAAARGCFVVIAVGLVVALVLTVAFPPLDTTFGNPPGVDPPRPWWPIRPATTSLGYDRLEASRTCIVCEGSAELPRPALVTQAALVAAAKAAVAGKVDDAHAYPSEDCAQATCVMLTTSSRTAAGTRVVESASVGASSDASTTEVAVTERHAGLQVEVGSGCVDRKARPPRAPASDDGALARRIAEAHVAGAE